MINPIEIILFTCCILIGYSYLIYPVLIIYLSKKINPKRFIRNSEADGMLSVALICSMYNEEDVIIEKIENYKNIVYPDMHLYIGSDGSSDKTFELLSLFKDDNSLSSFDFSRRGKVHVLNDLIAIAKADILVFTDANSMLKVDAVKRLIEPFCDPTIGAVCGRLELLDESGLSGESFYWKLENAVKRAEGKFKNVVGGNGAIYAVRRHLVKMMPHNTINDDFLISMRVYQQGFGMAYADNAVATEKVGSCDSIEFKRHVRDGAGHYRALKHLFSLLNPLYPKRFFFYVSHRVIRWFVPHLMLLLLILPCLHIDSLVARVIIYFQILFYSFAMVGFITRSHCKFLYIPYYFTYINIALLLGFFKNIFGIQKTTWDTTQRN